MLLANTYFYVFFAGNSESMNKVSISKTTKKELKANELTKTKLKGL
jgi:hypothetical protein